MSSEQIIAIATVAQAAFALCLLIVIVGQSIINKRQTKIMEGQTELSQNIDRSNRLIAMWTEHADLFDYRHRFYNTLRQWYSRAFPDHDEAFHDFIQMAPFPDPSPVGEQSLLSYVCDSQTQWENIMIWQFADRLLDLIDSHESLDAGELHHARSKLSHFWNKWASIEDIRQYLQPDPGELLLLTWLELATVLRTHGTGPGQQDLFKLAQDYLVDPMYEELGTE